MRRTRGARSLLMGIRLGSLIEVVHLGGGRKGEREKEEKKYGYVVMKKTRKRRRKV